MDFTTIADSATGVMTDAVSGAGPAIVAIAGLIMAVGLVIALLKKAK